MSTSSYRRRPFFFATTGDIFGIKSPNGRVASILVKVRAFPKKAERDAYVDEMPLRRHSAVLNPKNAEGFHYIVCEVCRAKYEADNAPDDSGFNSSYCVQPEEWGQHCYEMHRDAAA